MFYNSTPKQLKYLTLTIQKRDEFIVLLKGPSGNTHFSSGDQTTDVNSNVYLLEVRVRCSARKVKQNFIEINLISWSFLDVFLSRDEGKKQTFVT